MAPALGFWCRLNTLDFENLGYAIVALFVLTWATSIAVWKRRKIEERWGRLVRDSELSP